MSDWPQKFLHAYSERHHYDSVTANQDGLSLDDAYDIQHRYITLRKEPIVGYKAALTAPQAQQAMGVDVPIIGVLFADGHFPPNQPIVPNKQALLETEIGYKTAVAIDAAVTEHEVFDLMACCMPMIEVASPNLATKPNGLDLIATNSASYGFILGTENATQDVSLDNLEVALRRGEEVLLSGRSHEVLGGQAKALAWLINETLARGYTIDAGHILMSGSIGGMCPATPGTYIGQFGELGQIEFTIGEP